MSEEEKIEMSAETVDAVANNVETATQPAEESKPAETTVDPAPSPFEEAKPSEDAQPSPLEENTEPHAPASEAEDEDKCQQMNDLVESAVQQILTVFNGLQESFDKKLRYDAKKDEIIDRQFQELSQFKAGLVEKVTMQIVNDLIAEIDSTQKLVRFYENAECNEANFKKLQKVLRDIPASLCDILEKYGVTSFSSTVGVPFNPKRQRALKTTETGDASKDKTVHELLRLGFEQELEPTDNQPAKIKILRPEMVDVFVFNPALEEAPSAEKTEEPQQNADAQPEVPASESK